MIRTLIIYEGDEETITDAVRKMSLLLAPCAIYRTEEFSRDILREDDVFVIGGVVLNGALSPALIDFVTANRDLLSKRQLTLFASGGRSEEALESTRRLLGGSVVITGTIDSEDSPADTRRIVDYGLKIRDINEKYRRGVPGEILLEQIEEVLANERNCTFITGYDREVRGTVISYVYRPGYLYFFCEGSGKFATLLHNDNVCVTVCKEHRGQPHPAALQLFGKATIHYPGTESFKDFVARRGANYQKIMSMPHRLNGIEVEISRVEMYWSHWRKLGYDPRQTYYFQHPRQPS
ncbi:MAG: hypothetical protein WC369_10565 [Dehalococcoidales bacterium]|jgi:hypothetical protein